MFLNSFSFISIQNDPFMTNHTQTDSHIWCQLEGIPLLRADFNSIASKKRCGKVFTPRAIFRFVKKRIIISLKAFNGTSATRMTYFYALISKMLFILWLNLYWDKLFSKFSRRNFKKSLPPSKGHRGDTFWLIKWIELWIIPTINLVVFLLIIIRDYTTIA